MCRLIIGFAALIVGVGIHMGALALAERLVPVFPNVTDVIAERLPVVDFGLAGELAFAALSIWFVIVYFRQSERDLPRLLIMIGVFYALRGLFLILLPIGAPVGALSPSERFILYPYPAHAFFPGGHFGLLTLYGLSLNSQKIRWWFFSAVIIFGLGSVVARAHYTADLLGGALVAYSIYAWFKNKKRPAAV